MERGRRRMTGFTLVELMIVVIVLGIMAAIVIPQFTDHTSDARLATVDHDLNEIRQAIELYYQQHGNYPGAVDPASGMVPASNPETAFVTQLTQFTDRRGVVSSTRTAEFRYGPYLRTQSMPVNPFSGDNTLTAAVGSTSLSTDLYDGTSAWKFALPTGRFIANSAPDHAER
jgi:general secretion pathway protein G